ncbi:unnamed protein product [Prorocentrum cordatum]|uniref:Protein RFT1 homolog n=1 Tax=Prorocentrum cordatum TaxID=2364126 RepID=A0ABN9UYP1_9DINO|nr:unnamed protein product [Polarella glacialis]
MAPFAVLDAWQTVLEGALRGLGLQRRASTVKLVSMVAVRLIGAYLLAIWPVRLGVVGIWLAGTLGMVVTLIWKTCQNGLSMRLVPRRRSCDPSADARGGAPPAAQRRPTWNDPAIEERPAARGRAISTPCQKPTRGPSR